MSSNPILRNYRSRLFYAAVWLFIASAQLLVVYIASDFPFGYIFADSLAFNTLFAFLALLLWYPLYYNPWKSRNWSINFIFLKLLALLLLLVWLGAGYLSMYALFGTEAEYALFLKTSIGWKIMEGLLFYVVAALVYYLYIYIEELNEKANNEIRLNKLVKDGELNLLKSQINPHFLFNSLNSLNALILKNQEQAQQMLMALSDYLRYTVVATREEQSVLQKEIENIERYLSIEKLRFGERLHYDFEVAEDCLQIKIPSMLLQPLFENAVKHGVYESAETVRITTQINKERAYLRIAIGNNFDDENSSARKGSGTGLKNIGERLKLSYGSAASLQIKKENRQFSVIVKIPLT